MKVYLDMDGVIADFLTAAQERLQMKFPRPYIWGIGKMSGMGDSVWKSFDEEFWATIPLFPHTEALVKFLRDEQQVVRICSTVLTPGAEAGKRRWLRKYFPEFEADAIFTRHKAAFADVDSMLIDDLATNCARFAKAGGYAILFPADYNKNAGMSWTEAVVELKGLWE